MMVDSVWSIHNEVKVMGVFDGYQVNGPIPGRPWWRAVDGVLCRDDGLSSGFGFDLERMGPTDIRWAAEQDRKHPRRAPHPMVGQVWRYRVNGGRSAGWFDVETVIDAVRLSQMGNPAFVSMGNGDSHNVLPGQWPIPGAVLMYGPGSPWAPADYEVK